jgi:N-acetylglucosamine-6-sulfatase
MRRSLAHRASRPLCSRGAPARHPRVPWAVSAALLGLAFVGLAGCGGGNGTSGSGARTAHAPTAQREAPAAFGPGGTPAGGRRPNIVFVLTDDLSENLVRYMPHVLQMQRSGVSFSNYFVTDSLCCPSRASILTGRYPHDTRVFDNSPPEGGYSVFRERGEEQETFALALQREGYRTALMGKYLNG